MKDILQTKQFINKITFLLQSYTVQYSGLNQVLIQLHHEIRPEGKMTVGEPQCLAVDLLVMRRT